MADPVRVEGLAALIKAMRQAEADIADLKDANKAVGTIVLDASRPRTPRRTGRLAATGRASRAARKASVVYGKASVPYGPVIHFGWAKRNIKPQPWVLQAAARTESQWLAAYETDIQKILDSL
jgi:hypothetical protein